MPTVKLVVIGASGVGKTSLRGQYISGRFANGYRATIGADFITKTLPHPFNPEEEAVTLQIWDTAGQERFSTLSSAFFRGADAAVLMFDVNVPETMVALRKWWDEFKEKAPLEDDQMEDYCCVMVGNKIDLVEDGDHSVTKAEALAFLDELVPPSFLPSPYPRFIPQPPSPPEAGLSSIPLPSTSPPQTQPPERRSNSIPISPHRNRNLGSSSHRGSYSPKHALSKSRSRSSSRFYGTVTSTKTTVTIYHTPSSSLFDSFHSARSSPEPYPRPRSASPEVLTVESRQRRSTMRSTGSSGSSSGITITPSLFAREQALKSASIPTSDASDDPDPTPTTSMSSEPEKGPKLFFTSAKTGEGVNDVFEYIAQRVVKKWLFEEQREARLLHFRDTSMADTVRLGLQNVSGSGKGRLGRERPFECCS